MEMTTHGTLTLTTAALLAWACLGSTPIAAATTGGAGAHEERRTIDLEVVVESDPATLYRLFTSSDGMRTLFPGVEARIGDAEGGDYVVAFDPAHPDGVVNGTAGCRILALDPPRHVAFQWRGPTWSTGMNVEPLPTWVEVDFERLGAEGPTRVRLRHFGFVATDDAGWNRSYDFFDRGWGSMLERLRTRYAARPEASGTPATGTGGAL